jgi:hypothetical protein
VRDFVESRVVDGRQRIRAHISFHTAGEQVLWPYSYTRANVPPDMTTLDQRTFRALGRAMAATNGYRAAQSSDLYLSDGDMIDWMYARHRVFSYTFELYPRSGGVPERYYPPDEVIPHETRRNRDAVLALMGAAACPYAVLGRDARRAWCGPLFDDLEVDRGWQVDPRGRDTAADGAWARGVPAGAGAQPGSAISGQAVLVTGRAAGHDVDDGRTTIRSPLFTVPADGAASLRLRYWVALGAGATQADGLRVHLVGRRGGRVATLLEVSGDGTRREADWRTLETRLPEGLGGRLLAVELEAADVGGDALVEAGVDQVRVTAD